MNNEFEKYKAERLSEYIDPQVLVAVKAAWNACQATLQARMDELETCIKDKDHVIFSQQMRIAGLEADCKVMAEVVQLAHKHVMFRTCCCHMRRNPACTIAAKYREGE